MKTTLAWLLTHLETEAPLGQIVERLVWLGRDDHGNGEGFEPGRAIFDAFDIVAEPDQALDDPGERRFGLEMGQEPGERRFHGAPRTSEGMASGRNP